MSKALFIAASLIVLGACRALWSGMQQTVLVGDLTKEYVESKDVARNRYDGKPIRVEGYVLASAWMPRQDGTEGLILLGEKEGKDSPHVSCWFTRGEIEKFSRVQRGSRVTVEGIFNGERGTELRFCRLVRDEGPME